MASASAAASSVSPPIRASTAASTAGGVSLEAVRTSPPAILTAGESGHAIFAGPEAAAPATVGGAEGQAHGATLRVRPFGGGAMVQHLDQSGVGDGALALQGEALAVGLAKQSEAEAGHETGCRHCAPGRRLWQGYAANPAPNALRRRSVARPARACDQGCEGRVSRVRRDGKGGTGGGPHLAEGVGAGAQGGVGCQGRLDLGAAVGRQFAVDERHQGQVVDHRPTPASVIV